MAEDDFVYFNTVSWVLSTCYERDVGFDEISSIAGRLSKLGLVRWRILRQGHFHFRNKASQIDQHNKSAGFTASVAGKSYLALPRHVA